MRHGWLAGFVVAWLGQGVTAAGSQEPPLPEPAPGWTIELAGQGPQIASASALVAVDDTIYLGLDHSVAAYRKGELFTLTRQLGRVHGLDSGEGGALFVAHGSQLSVVRDNNGDGQPDTREELVSGLKPGRGPGDPILDHGPGGIRLGLDGWLYLAVGDRGIPRAKGKDGRTLTMQGGGVIRVRPDGTGLEAVSTGERNPRSVAMSATGEIFTFGPGSPEARWPGGLTHHVVGGHYGYPYQFLTAPFRALPTLGGDAGRAGGECLCYNEDGLPARYQGNLFHCDPERQCVVRSEIRKAGGTYTIVQRTSVVVRGKLADFYPRALATAGDGAGFWIVDSGSEQDHTGRLFRLTYSGSDRTKPAPRPAGDDLASQIAALDHPALSVRVQAQRQLAHRGNAAVADLIRRLHAEESEPGRVHALWALDSIGSIPARQAIRQVLADRSPQIRLQAARSCGQRADREAVAQIASLLADRDPAVRREAAIALGRSGDVAALAPLLAALIDPDRFAAWSIRTAIRRLGYPKREDMAAALRDPRRFESALTLADESWSVPVVQALVDVLAIAVEPALRGRIVANLASQYRKYPEWDGQWWGLNPFAQGLPKKTRDWAPEGMTAVLGGLRRGAADHDSSVRFQAIMALGQVGPAAAPILLAGLASEPDAGNQASIVEALGEMADPATIRMLTELVTDSARPEAVRAVALDAIGRFRGPDILRARLALVYDPKAPDALVARALVPLVRDGFLPLNDLAGFLESPREVVRAAALLSLNVKKVPPPEIKEQVLARLDDPSSQVRQAALLAVGLLQIREAVPKLLELAARRNSDHRAAAIRALCRMPDHRAAAFYREASADSDPSLSRAAALALRAIGGEVDPAVARAGGTEPRTADVTGLGRFALNHPGDPRAGEELFFENKTVDCGNCHTAAGRGSASPGPDLSGLAKRSDKARMIRSLLAPSGPLAAAHQSVADQIRALTPLQLTDLISFLEELKGTPVPLPRGTPSGR